MLGLPTLAVLTAASLSPASPPWAIALDQQVEKATRGFRGQLSLYVGDVTDDDSYGRDERRPTYLSSTIKVAVALAVLREVDEGGLSLSKEVPFGVDDVRDGVGPLAHLAPGLHFTVARLLELMLESSDNAAADLLIGQVGEEGVRTELRRRGIGLGPLRSLLEERRETYAQLDPRARELTPAQFHRLGQIDSLDARAAAFSQMMHRAPPWTAADLSQAFVAFYAGGTNSGPMEEMGHLLEQIARCTDLNPASCQRIKTLMHGCRTGSHRILAGLSPGTWWAHKTGTQLGRACDVGIAHLPSGQDVVIAACVRDFESVPRAEALFAAIGRAVGTVFVSADPGDGPKQGAR